LGYFEQPAAASVPAQGAVAPVSALMTRKRPDPISPVSEQPAVKRSSVAVLAFQVPARALASQVALGLELVLAPEAEKETLQAVSFPAALNRRRPPTRT